MLPEERVVEVLATSLPATDADQAEALLMEEGDRLTRFAGNVIHQNVASTNHVLSLRVVYDKKIGTASTNRLTKDEIERTARKAAKAAKPQAPNEDFKSLPSGGKLPDVEGYSEDTADFSAEERADGVRQVVEVAEERGAEVAGRFQTSVYQIGIKNTEGVEGVTRNSVARLTVNASKEERGQTGYGWSEAVSKSVSSLDPSANAAEALRKAESTVEKRELKPGNYGVVLEPYAVASMLGTLGFNTFNALAYQEDRSFLNGRLGEKVVSESVDVWDDGTDAEGLPLPFDFEGVPKRRVSLLESGRAKNLVYDSYTAGREDRDSTGHALPAPNPWGPIPTHMYMRGGETEMDDLASELGEGVYVTRFHYTNTVEPEETTFTGMSRDGTYYVEGGEIQHAVKNLRFTEKIVDALSDVVAVSRERRTLPSAFRIGSVTCPGVCLRSFRFTGTTEF